VETVYIIAINGVVSAIFSFFAYKQSNKKSKIDFLNNQVSNIKSEIDGIQEKTYELYQLRFINDKDIYEDLNYRILNQKIDSLLNKILVYSSFKDFTMLLTDYNIFANNILEAEDKDSAKIYMNNFDDINIELKRKLDNYQSYVNN